jgi:Carboxypeptidase regulatory-like domain
MARGLRGLLLTMAMLALWTGSAHAQGGGSIFGKVTDASGAVLPGVTVTVTGTGLQQPLVQQTAESGAYQFPTVPVGTYTVTFEMSGFKKGVRNDVIITIGFNAGIDQKLEIGAMTEEVTVSGESPVVDLKKTTTGGVFDADVLEKIPTARDPWQIVNMAAGVQLSGYNVGGASSGQQMTPSVRGTTANVSWNVEGGSITDLSSNSSSIYFNFDSFDQIQVTTGGGDVSVQTSGVNINLITKSGSNVFKGTGNMTFSNDKMQGDNVTEELFNAGANGFLSGNPLKRIGVYSGEVGGPIVKNRLWWWVAADKQDINTGVTNFFDAGAGGFCQDLIAAQKNRVLSGAITYNNLSDVQKCLKNDKTTIQNMQGKMNFALTSSNKFQYLFIADDKVRNARGASATTQVEATSQQFSDKAWGFANPTHSLTHTWIASNRLVFNNMFTYVGGGFFLDYQDKDTCGASRHIPGTTDYNEYLTGDKSDANCLYNQQSLLNRTTSVTSRSQLNSYQTTRKTYELKSDGTYFLSNTLGGDHSLKFGVGWKKAPILTWSHYSGGARAQVQCVGNTLAGCGDGSYVAVGSAAGIVPYNAVLYRDQLRNNDWHGYNGYIQDEFSRGRVRLKGGLRYDWQTSKHLGGCVPNNPLAPTMLPSQCDEETDTDAATGRKIQSFGNLSPRFGATYDLLGNGKTSVHASGSYYFDQKITLANALTGLFTQPALTWGNNQASGACSATAGASCWTDANRDGLVQTNELIGTPTAASSRFDLNTGIFNPAGNIVDPSAKIGRTREGIVGVQHELIKNLAVGVDYIYRKYDRGTATYTVGYEPGSAGYPLSQIYTGPLTYTDAPTGVSSTYYVICQGCQRPSGAAQITMTNPNYQTYSGVDITVNKRYSNKWQASMGATIQKSPAHYPEGSVTYINPTGREFNEGTNPNAFARFIWKANGSYSFPWDITASANLNIQDGNGRTVSINGPGNVYGGVNAAGAATTISYTTLTSEPLGTTRYETVKLLDLGVQKALRFSDRYQIKLMFDAFNIFNINTITTYSSGNRSLAGFTQPTAIIAPRVFRVGARVMF